MALATPTQAPNALANTAERATPLLEVRDLSIHFRTGSGEVQVTNQVSFQLRAG